MSIPNFIIHNVRFDYIDWIQVGFKVIWPAIDFEMLETVVVKSHQEADMLELRVFEHPPGKNTPDGAVTLQLWDRANGAVLSQVSQVYPPPKKELKER